MRQLSFPGKSGIAMLRQLVTMPALRYFVERVLEDARSVCGTTLRLLPLS